MKKRFVAVALALLLIVSMVPSAFAADDTTPPVFTGISINQTVFNVGDTMIIDIKCDDTESGIDIYRCQVSIISSLQWKPLQYLLVEKTDTGIQARLTFDNTYGGTYRIVDIRLGDLRGNYKYLSQMSGAFDISFTVNNAPYPQITNLSVDKTTAKAGDIVTYTITGSDATGITGAGMSLELPGGSYYTSYKIPMQAVPGSEGTFAGSLLITADMPSGIYYPRDVYITGGSGLTTNGNPNDMAYVFGETRLTISSSVPTERVWPQLLSYELSAHQAIAGEKLTVTVRIDTKGNQAQFTAGISLKNPPNYSPDNYICSSLVDMGGGTYAADITIPYTSKSGVYSLYMYALDLHGNGMGLTVPDSFYRYEGEMRYFVDGDVTISPLISVSGTDNRSLLVGDPFDPMQGVSATNAYTGDITSKITMSGGDINTSVPGLYLIKYIVTDETKLNGGTVPIRYTDYRWIGVSEIAPAAPMSDGEVPLALTDGSLVIDATSADASIQKDGQSIPFTNVVTEPGEYTVSSSGAGSTSLAYTGGGNSQAMTLASHAAPGVGAPMTNNRHVQTMAFGSQMGQAARHVQMLSYSSDASSPTAAAVIDRSGPSMSAAWGKVSSKAIAVTIKTKDVSGVAETKYMTGVCSLEQCRNQGTAFASVFTVAGLGKYTVYARDQLGNESVTLYNINTASSSNSAYIENVAYSAGRLSRGFSKTCYSYNLTLGENEGSVTIAPVKEFEGATMTIAGKAVSSYTVSLANGKSVTVKVKVKYGKSSHTYKFKVTRMKSSDNYLASLSTNAGSFDRAFDPNVTSYTLTLDENTKSARISDTVAAPGFSRTSASKVNITLQNGQTKVVKITVKAQSGAKKMYVITVRREASTNAALKTLKVNTRTAPLTPAFNAGVTNYTVMLPAATGSVTISASAAGYKAVVYMDGKRRTSQRVNVANGGSVTVHIAVTAQAGNTTDYYVTVTRQ